MSTAIDLGAAANPDWAERALSQLSERNPGGLDRLQADPEMAHRVVVVTGASEALGTQIATQPAMLETLASEPEAWDAVRIRDRGLAQVAELPDGPEDPRASEILAAVQRVGLLRVATRDMLGLVDTDGAAAELAALADGLIAAAHGLVTIREDPPSAEVVVLAMGKLGGEELNYVSDVDVLFLHKGDNEAANRMAKAMLHLLGGHTPLGPVYEMDANLRPEGRNGPLTRTLESYHAYYERWAKTWEFQSLLKARCVVGPAALADAFTEMVSPHVWPDSLGAEAVTEIQEMKRRVERSRPVARDGTRQLKLAPGGLRDIEFATQLLQLVHGPADPSLRARGTVPALAALAEGGYIDDGDAALFTDAYLFLRTVEHRLQLRQLRRTHTVPSAPEDIQRLARTMGFRDLPVRPAGEAFTSEMARVRSGVRRLHEQLFYRPLLSTLASYGVEERAVEAGRFDAEAAERRLRALAFTSPGKARAHLQAMVQGGSRTARQMRVVLPTMLEALADQPDPDGGLAAIRDLYEQLKDNPRFIRTIRDNPPAARLLARVLGASPRLSVWLGRQPEVLALLDDEDELSKPRSREELASAAAGLVRRGGGTVSGDALRRFKRREALRAALRDLHEDADVAQIGQELTWLGEGLLHAALSTIVPEGIRVAVIGMGRFGAGELGHASDLDVLFLHDGPNEDAQQAIADVLEFLSEVTPEGQSFRIDPDLRPEGRGGPLSRTLESYEAYYDRWAEPWEMQALTQARPVAGDQALAEAFMEAVTPRVYPDPAPLDRVIAIRTMKARVEAERAGRRGVQPAHRRRPRRVAQPGRAAAADLKLGEGGLSDVEWTVQLLSIIHGGADPTVRGTGTLPGLARLAEAGVLAQEEALWLRSGWMLLSQVRNALYLMKVRDTSSLPTQPAQMQQLAGMLHHGNAQSLQEAIDRARRRIRKVFDRRFFDA